jgi:predicted transposase YbfD/YdcC
MLSMSFIDYFGSITDPRTDINVKHELLDVIFLTITGVVSGCEGWKDIHEFGCLKIEWLRKYRPFKNGIPVDDTIARIISALVPEEFTKSFIDWVNELRRYEGKEQISIDGKTLRRSFDNGDRMSALHSVTVWSKSNGLVLAQSRSKSKKNENKTVMELLDLIEIGNAIITMDAMNTQRSIEAKLIQKKADYVLPVKENQKNLLEEIQDYFVYMNQQHAEIVTKSTYSEVDSGHGRIEQRIYRQLLINELIPEAGKWSGIKTVVEVLRQRELKGKIENEIQYYISSLPINLPLIADTIRGHWEVENKAHYVLDVTYREDDSRIRRENAAENIAVARRFALNLARLHPQKNSMKGKLKQAMWSDDFRDQIILGHEVCKV